MLLQKTFLQRVQLSVLLESFYGFDAGAVGLHRQQRAGLDGGAVYEYRARAAIRRIAADVRPREIQVLAEKVDQQQPRLHLGRVRLAIDGDGHAHAVDWFEGDRKSVV